MRERVKRGRALVGAVLPVAVLVTAQPGLASDAPIASAEPIVGQPLAPPGPSVSSCEIAIERAERKHNLPDGLLLAMGNVEARFGGRVWPWSLNVRGEPHRHNSYGAALSHLQQLTEDGVQNIDVGCLQLNMYWVARGMPLPQALDPEANAMTAAYHLRYLRRKYHSWSAAVAHYHSRRSHFQRRYQCRVAIEWADIRRLSPPHCDPS